MAIWAVGYGFELASHDLSDMLFWIKIEYIGISFASSSWLWFCLKYVGLEDKTNRRNALLILLVPVITFTLVLTNEWHHIYYKETQLDFTGPFPLLAITIGPWYIVHLIYFHITFFAGSVILIYNFKDSEAIFKNQAYLIVAAGIFPWLINIIYLSGYRPFGHIDLTPYAFIFTYIFVGIGLLRYELFNIKPIARDRVFEALTNGILVFNAEQRIIDFNSAIKKIIPDPSERLIGQKPDEVFEQNNPYQFYLDAKEKANFETTITNNGHNRQFVVEFVPILDKKSIYSGMIMIFNDISEEKAVQEKLKNQAEELRKNNTLKDKLFTIISHDLKGPISGIRELINLTHEGVLSKEEFFEVFPEINRNMDSVAILLENLLAWTSSQLKGEKFEPKVFDLEKLVNQQISLFERTAKQKGITLALQRYGTLWVKADQNMIDLVLRNLISNALKFSGKSDLVTIILNEKQSQVHIKVKDTGVGISPENVLKLQNRESFTTTGKNNELGTGLGMLLVHDYIQINGGRLTIQSELEKGSEFSFSLHKASPLKTG